MIRPPFEQKYFEYLQSSPYIQSVKRPGREIVAMETYTYDLVVGGPLNLNVDVSNTLITHADSDFIFAMLSASLNISANGDMKYNRNVTLQIQDQSTGKFFFNQPTVITLVGGGGGFPFVYPSPRVVNPNTGLQFTVRNRDTAQNYNQAFFAMLGTRIFYR